MINITAKEHIGYKVMQFKCETGNMNMSRICGSYIISMTSGMTTDENPSNSFTKMQFAKIGITCFRPVKKFNVRRLLEGFYHD